MKRPGPLLRCFCLLAIRMLGCPSVIAENNGFSNEDTGNTEEDLYNTPHFEVPSRMEPDGHHFDPRADQYEAKNTPSDDNDRLKQYLGRNIEEVDVDSYEGGSAASHDFGTYLGRTIETAYPYSDSELADQSGDINIYPEPNVRGTGMENSAYKEKFKKSIYRPKFESKRKRRKPNMQGLEDEYSMEIGRKQDDIPLKPARIAEFKTLIKYLSKEISRNIIQELKSKRICLTEKERKLSRSHIENKLVTLDNLPDSPEEETASETHEESDEGFDSNHSKEIEDRSNNGARHNEIENLQKVLSGKTENNIEKERKASDPEAKAVQLRYGDIPERYRSRHLTKRDYRDSKERILESPSDDGYPNYSEEVAVRREQQTRRLLKISEDEPDPDEPFDINDYYTAPRSVASKVPTPKKRKKEKLSERQYPKDSFRSSPSKYYRSGSLGNRRSGARDEYSEDPIDNRYFREPYHSSHNQYYKEDTNPLGQEAYTQQEQFLGKDSKSLDDSYYGQYYDRQNQYDPQRQINYEQNSQLSGDRYDQRPWQMDSSSGYSREPYRPIHDTYYGRGSRAMGGEGYLLEPRGQIHYHNNDPISGSMGGRIRRSLRPFYEGYDKRSSEPSERNILKEGHEVPHGERKIRSIVRDFDGRFRYNDNEFLPYELHKNNYDLKSKGNEISDADTVGVRNLEHLEELEVARNAE